MRKALLTAAVALLLGSNAYAQLGAGDLAFIGFNADGEDNIAFVVLEDVLGGTTVRFTDNEFNNGSLVDQNESIWSWVAPLGGVSAGTVVTLDRINGPAPADSTASIGSFVWINTANRGVANSDEAIFVYTGTEAAPTFITALFTDTFANTGGNLTGTGLAFGTSALNLQTIDTDTDIAAYVGSRNNQATFPAYGPLVFDTANWISQDGGGDQSIDGIAPDVPFNTTPFTLVGGAAATPEPATLALLGLALAGTALSRRRK